MGNYFHDKFHVSDSITNDHTVLIVSYIYINVMLQMVS